MTRTIAKKFGVSSSTTLDVSRSRTRQHEQAVLERAEEFKALARELGATELAREIEKALHDLEILRQNRDAARSVVADES